MCLLAAISISLLTTGVARAAEEPPPLDSEIAAALAADAEPEPSDAQEPSGSGPTAAASMNPDLALILDVAFAYFSEEENLQTGAHDPTETGFNLQQLELSVGAAVDPYF